MKSWLPLALAALALAGCASDDAPAAAPVPRLPVAASPVPTAAPTMQAMAPAGLVGVWQGTVRDRSRRGGQLQTWRLELAPDGSYRSTSVFAQGGQIQHWGRFTAGDGFIRLSLDGWAPRQECGAAGCFPLEMPQTDTIVLVALGAQQMVTEQGALQRLQ